jgi:hypothetical protein
MASFRRTIASCDTVEPNPTLSRSRPQLGNEDRITGQQLTLMEDENWLRHKKSRNQAHRNQ